MKTVATILILAAAVWLAAPSPARADIIDDVRAVFTQKDAADDPFQPLHDLYVNHARTANDKGDYVNALEYYRIAATIDRRDHAAITEARALKKKLEGMAAEEFKKGSALLDSGDKAGALAQLAGSLRLNPDDTKALPLLKDGLGEAVAQQYTIEEGDTLRRVAEKVYGNTGGELLLTRINNLSIVDTLKPGDTLIVPLVSKSLAKRLHLAEVAPPPAPGAGKVQAATKAEPVVVAQAPVEEDITESEAQNAGALLAMAKLQFGNGLYETAVSMAEEVLAADPANADAALIRNNSYYELAEKDWARGSAAEAMRMLIRLPKGYQDSEALKKKVRAKLDADSEPLYLAGVKYFLAEDLAKAVEQWELTLQVNPYHAKARTDLEKARQLLEAVKGL